MIQNSQKKLTGKQRKSRFKARIKKRGHNGQMVKLNKIIEEKDKEIYELKEKIKLLEGQLLIR